MLFDMCPTALVKALSSRPRYFNLSSLLQQDPYLQLRRAPAPCHGVQDCHVGIKKVLVRVASTEQRQVAPVWQRHRSMP